MKNLAKSKYKLKALSMSNPLIVITFSACEKSVNHLTDN